jgi:flagellar motor switch/type III secretory pathway protein FliN
LGKAEVHQLGVGDIIISPTVPNSIDGELRLEVGQQGYFSVDVEASGRQLNIRSGYCRGVSNMTTEEMAEQRKNLAEDLPVELVLELGRHRLSGEEVLSLGAGDVLTLNRPLVGGIDLRVGGKLVARGELVDVEGEAGVRLLEMVE